MKKVIIASLLIAVTAVIATSQNPVNLYGRAAQGAKGVVAAAKPEASQVGVDILKKGGNAVDAAVATAFALGVLEPNASGLGGGGFMIIKLANMKEAVVIDFRETAPAASTADMFKYGDDGKVIDNASVVGGLSVGRPRRGRRPAVRARQLSVPRSSSATRSSPPPSSGPRRAYPSRSISATSSRANSARSTSSPRLPRYTPRMACPTSSAIPSRIPTWPPRSG